MRAYSKFIGKLCGRPEGESPEGLDLAERLDGLVAASGEELDWRRSIVDLMKAAGHDASYGARKKLALELGYDEDTLYRVGSAAMNEWLLREVMDRLAKSGVRVPEGATTP